MPHGQPPRQPIHRRADEEGKARGDRRRGVRGSGSAPAAGGERRDGWNRSQASTRPEGIAAAAAEDQPGHRLDPQPRGTHDGAAAEMGSGPRAVSWRASQSIRFCDDLGGPQPSPSDVACSDVGYRGAVRAEVETIGLGVIQTPENRVKSPVQRPSNYAAERLWGLFRGSINESMGNSS